MGFCRSKNNITIYLFYLILVIVPILIPFLFVDGGYLLIYYFLIMPLLSIFILYKLWATFDKFKIIFIIYFPLVVVNIYIIYKIYSEFYLSF